MLKGTRGVIFTAARQLVLNRRLLLVPLAAVIISNIAACLSLPRIMHSSLADCIVNASLPRFVGIIAAPLSVFTVLRLFGCNELPNIILRFRSRRRFYLMQCAEIAAVCLLMSLMHIFSAVLFGSFFADSVINWSKTHSLYFMTTRTTSGLSFFALTAAVTALVFLTLLTVSLTAYVIKTAVGSGILSLAYAVAAGGWNCVAAGYPVFSGWLAVRYGVFVQEGLLPLRIIGALIADIALIAAGGALFAKRDFS